MTVPQSAGPPRSISNPCAREGSTASRFSRTALGLPGRLTMRLRPRMPAAARESMARGEQQAQGNKKLLVSAFAEEQEDNQEEQQVAGVDVL